MAHSEVRDEIAAPAEEVWKFFGWRPDDERLRQLTEMGALPGAASWSGHQPGATRTISMVDGGRLVERLEALDEANFRYSYRIIDAGPLPVSGYLGHVEITATGPDACTIMFSADFNEEPYEVMHQAFCRGGIAAMKAILGADDKAGDGMEKTTGKIS